MNDLKWQIGEVEVHQIVELDAGEIIQSVINEATPENIIKIPWLYPHFADKNGKLKALVQAFFIRSEGKNILIDACNGNGKSRVDIPEWANLQTDFLKKLRNLRVDEKDIDIVACTHLHCDHVGWNTTLVDNRWVPTFPNAKYLFSRSEYAYWRSKPEKEIADDKAAFDDSVIPIEKAGLMTLVDVNCKIDNNVSFMPTPGHTPSHVSVYIESKEQRAIISGDLLHHPCQIAEPDWSTAADTFPEQAIESRKKILESIADRGTLLIGSHFADPVAGRVIRTQDKYTFVV